MEKKLEKIEKLVKTKLCSCASVCVRTIEIEWNEKISVMHTFYYAFTASGRTIYLILNSRAINKLPFYLVLSVLMQTKYFIYIT